MPRNTPARFLVALLAVSGLAAPLLAQPSKAPPPDALRGPEVRDRQVPGVEGSFGEPGGDRKRFVSENRLPPRVFREAMETILSPEAPDELRVNDEQRTRFRSWMDDFQKSVAAYMKEHAAELRELRQKAGEPGPRPGPGGPDAKKPDPEPMKPEVDPKETGAARERLRALMSGAPKIEDLYTKIWSELSPAQQKAIDGKLQEFRDRQAKEREDKYVQQRLGKKKGDAGKPGEKPGPDARPGPNPAERAAPIDAERRERLLRLFSRLTPEQQEQLLTRLEQRRAENSDKPPLPPRRPGNNNERGEPKPAPEPDDSMIPPPPKAQP